MWALRGALWYLGQGNGASPWSVTRWIVTDFVQGCPDLVVVDDRDGLDYIRVLSAMPDFAAAWSHYRPVAPSTAFARSSSTPRRRSARAGSVAQHAFALPRAGKRCYTLA